MPGEPTQESNTASVIRPILEGAGRRAGAIEEGGLLPTVDEPRLVRGDHGLETAEAETIDWRPLAGELTRSENFWESLAAAAQDLKSDDEIESCIGWADGAMRAPALWRDVLTPLLRQHQRETGRWEWREGEIEELVESWRGSHAEGWRQRCCRATLQNCRSMVDEVIIRPGLIIRRLDDTERDVLWRRYGAEVDPAPHRPSITEIEAWDLVIDYRWTRKAPDPDEDHAIEVVRDVVRALRLHHPGMSGATVIWIGPDPDLRWDVNAPDSMYRSPEVPVDGFEGRFECHLGAASGEALKSLFDRLRLPLKGNLGLVLDRLDSVYSRRSPQDQLIDLWVALEALLLPDIRDELRFRSSLRLAHLLGEDPVRKKEIFDLAMDSYVVRSKVVHGASKERDLGPIVQTTRMLTVDAVCKWLLDPPEKGVATLDMANFG
jgi:hypothetical protein